MSTLDPKLSATPLAAEHHAIDLAMQRIRVDDELRFDASVYDPKAVARVLAQWKWRMVFEHRSSTVFSQLAAQLFEANASMDAKVVMLRMAQDELRHTITCADVIRALGGTPAEEADLQVQALAVHKGVSPEERALRNVIYTTSCSEMVACSRFVATLDRMKDPYLRQVNRRLLADEVLHGQFGFHYLEAWRPWLDENPSVMRSLERFLTHAFAIIEQELAPKPPFRTLSEDELALGGDDASLAREVFYGTLEAAVVPGLSRFGLDAERCWRDRKRAV